MTFSYYFNFAQVVYRGVAADAPRLKRLNDRGPKLLRNIYFYFYTIEFDSNELYKSCQFLAILPSPKAWAYQKDSMTAVLNS